MSDYIDKMYKLRKKKCNFVKSLYCSEFRLYLDKKRYFKVKVFENVKAMHNYRKDDDFYGMCVYFSDGKGNYIDTEGNTYKNCLGEVLLSKKYLGARFVVHEISHAVLYYYNNFVDNEFKNLGNKTKNNEAMCYLLGDCSSLVYHILWKYELLK
jgi:hypothetical protein